MLRVIINGTGYTFEESISILHALGAIGIEVPTLCHDERLNPYGGCRLCVVQVEGLPRPVTACTTQLLDGMSIQTHSPEIEHWRRTLLKLLARKYPRDPVARWPDKEFNRYVRAYGLETEVRDASDCPGCR